MPGLGVGEVAVWLLTTGVVIGIPAAVLLLVFRLGRRSTSTPPNGQHHER